MDINMVLKSGAKALVIGFLAFAVPLILTMPVAFIIKSYLTSSDKRLGDMLPYIAFTESQISFHVIFSLLADLKLLNSEVGRLAMSSSMISNVFCFCTLLLHMTLGESFRASASNWSVLKVASILGMVMLVMYVMRPIMIWIVKQTPEGSNNVKEEHALIIFLMVLATSFFGQIVGQPVLFGPMILGLAVPPGPPLGTSMQNKLDSIVSNILLPLYFVGSAGRTDKLDITATGFKIVMLIALLAFLGKFIGTILPSMYCDMPFQDALALGLVMGSQGLVDLHLYRRALFLDVISNGVYTIMIYSAIVIAGITSIMVKYTYKPSRRYMISKSTLQQNINNTEFRILTCVHRESNAPAIIEILEASNATRKSLIGVYLLHLIELQRVATPLLIAHRKNDTYSIHYNRSRHIINVFNLFEHQNQGLISLMSFTAMSPYGRPSVCPES
ncbi:Cation/H(+) antiporter [Thalictrum thalictroides]|uniref:Cation/H(+) antiporter n=1 Tax=Thalictrum thalictroides TaxID=46969 RepID=A0A7J6WFK0_THATH|nr:Cation/H(+) antiporter [Thalictrum thalictroides]